MGLDIESEATGWDSRHGRVIRYAIYAASSTCLGSFFVIVAPGDGQTGACTYPLWIIGLIYGSLCIGNGGLNRKSRTLVVSLAMLSIFSIVCGYIACVQYESEATPSIESISTNSGNSPIK